MKSVTGNVPEEMKEWIEDEIVEQGKYPSVSAFIRFCIIYTAKHKYGKEF